MKKIIFISLISVIALTSCYKNCKQCKQVTYVKDKYDHETVPAEYCEDDLDNIEGKKNIDPNDSTIVTVWECE